MNAQFLYVWPLRNTNFDKISKLSAVLITQDTHTKFCQKTNIYMEIIASEFQNDIWSYIQGMRRKNYSPCMLDFLLGLRVRSDPPFLHVWPLANTNFNKISKLSAVRVLQDK